MSSLTSSAPRVTPTEANGGTAALKAAGPLAVVSLAALVAALAATGGDGLELATSPFAIAASLTGLAALTALSIGMGSFAARRAELRSGMGHLGWVIASIGAVLAAGGQWAQLFVLPGLAGPAPDLATNGIGSVVAGYIASYIVLGIGWIITGIAVLRAGKASRSLAWALIVGGLLCITPLPVRFVVVAVAASFLGRSGTRDRA